MSQGVGNSLHSPVLGFLAGVITWIQNLSDELFKSGEGFKGTDGEILVFGDFITSKTETAKISTKASINNSQNLRIGKS